MNFKGFGIDEKKLGKDNLHEIALLAYEDQCSPTNPLPMVADMEEIMADATMLNVRTS